MAGAPGGLRHHHQTPGPKPGLKSATTLCIFRLRYIHRNHRYNDSRVMYKKLFAKDGLSLERLWVWVKVVKAGSIIEAADRDLTRASQYSRQISELEQYFGFKLAERRKRRLIFNAAGKELSRKANEVLAILQGFCAREQKTEVKLNVAAYESLIHWMLIPLTAKLQRNFPEIRWVIRNNSTSEIIRGLKELTFDVGLVRKNAVEKPLKSEHILKMTYSVFAARSAIKPNSDWRSVLSSVPFAARQSDGEFWQACETLAATHRLKLDVRLSCVSAVEACRAVSQGNYCSILPSIAAVELDESKFAHFEIPFRYERSICLAWNPRTLSIRDLGPYIGALKQELLEQA
jgi:DNA-binding transcriptional LysR family regulator